MAITTRQIIRALLEEERQLEKQLGYVKRMIAQQRAVEIHMQSKGHKKDQVVHGVVQRAGEASAEPPDTKVEAA